MHSEPYFFRMYTIFRDVSDGIGPFGPNLKKLPIFGSKRPKMGPKAPIFTKTLDVRFLMAFYSKTRACIEAYSTLSETQYYFQSGKMYLPGIKCIF